MALEAALQVLHDAGARSAGTLAALLEPEAVAVAVRVLKEGLRDEEALRAQLAGDSDVADVVAEAALQLPPSPEERRRRVAWLEADPLWIRALWRQAETQQVRQEALEALRARLERGEPFRATAQEMWASAAHHPLPARLLDDQPWLSQPWLLEAILRGGRQEPGGWRGWVHRASRRLKGDEDSGWWGGLARAALRLGDGEVADLWLARTSRRVSGASPKLRPAPDGAVLSLRSTSGVRLLDAHAGAITACATLPGNRLITGASDGSLKVWAVPSGSLVASLESQPAAILACIPMADGRLITLDAEGHLQLWDASDEQLTPRHPFTGADELVSCATVVDGRLVAGSWTGTLYVWDIRLRPSLSGFIRQAPDRGVTSCIALPGGGVATGARDGSLTVWDLQASAPRMVLEGHQGPVWACATWGNGSRLVSASTDGTLKVWELGSGQLLRTLSGHSRAVRACAVTANGQHAVSGADDGTLRIWNLEQGVCLRIFREARPFGAISVAPDSQTAFAGDNVGQLWFLDLEVVTRTAPVSSSVHPVAAAALEPGAAAKLEPGAAAALEPGGAATLEPGAVAGLERESAAGETTPEQLVALRHSLATMLPEAATARLVAEDTGLRTVRIDFSGSAEETWNNVLQEARRVGAVRTLVEKVHDRYPDAPELERFLDEAPQLKATLRRRPLGLFISCAQQDQRYLRQLEAHLGVLIRHGIVDVWHVRTLVPGSERITGIDPHLEEADLILLLVSPDLLASDYLESAEMARALARHRAGTARVVPILLRPTLWSDTPLASLQALPRNNRPITQWRIRDQAWLEVVDTLPDLVQTSRRSTLR